MRSFGSDVHDLDVDFTLPAPVVATDLLCRCGPMADEATWDLTVGARIFALVALAMQSSASGTLAICLRCRNRGCAEAIEIDITAADLREWSAGSGSCAIVEIQGRPLPLRAPTGRDQRRWLTAAWLSRETARSEILAALLTGVSAAELDGETLTVVEAELARIDPLVDFTLTVACPACGDQAPHAIDVERRALTTLRTTHERLLLSVARLASTFHWTESAILALPAWRRERYLVLADAL